MPKSHDQTYLDFPRGDDFALMSAMTARAVMMLENGSILERS